ncbi:MAG: D-alanine--D-alanine ligase [Agarilytica sp.]
MAQEAAEPHAEQDKKQINQGLPPLDLREKPISYFEFWPAWVFYLPVALYWVLLSIRYRNFGLPMVVNPSIPLGGMVGESKYDILEQGGNHAKQYILPYLLRQAPQTELLTECDDSLREHVENDLTLAAAQGIELPFVVKPELGCRGAGVKIVRCKQDLESYLKVFPRDRNYMLQKLAPYQAEVGVFYERMPGDDLGRVTSLTLKYRPTVVGDGKRDLRTLIAEDPRASVLRELYYEKNSARLHYVAKPGEEVALAFAGSHCRGSIFRNGNKWINEGLERAIDAIALDFPDFHYGRFDIKFKDLESLQRGEEFVVIEINGVSSEKTHIWDSRTGLFAAYATLIAQYATLFKMGRQLQKQGRKVPSIRELITTWWRELKRSDNYPATD